MNNQLTRLAATLHFHATVVRQFSQASGQCVGWTATWLRKRSMNKDMFGNAKYFSSEPIKKMMVFTAEDYAENKATARQAIFPKDAAAERAYIESGSKGQRRGLHFVESRGPTPLSYAPDKPCSGLIDELARLGMNKQLASIGMTTKIAHAVGVDCSGPGCVYFDPCLGEFTFPDARQLGRWWRYCFKDRANKPGSYSAWDQIFDGPFRMDVYRLP
jgi:Yersinia/Haemophilus virulence surface antigen